jgi:photosystem II stability/assembly factor-like uncharacterized protein
VRKVDDAWIAVGGGGVVLRSSEGSTWTAVNSGTHSELFAVAGAGPGLGTAVAVAGVDACIRSTDGGKSWKVDG